MIRQVVKKSKADGHLSDGGQSQAIWLTQVLQEVVASSHRFQPTEIASAQLVMKESAMVQDAKQED